MLLKISGSDTNNDLIFQIDPNIFFQRHQLIRKIMPLNKDHDNHPLSSLQTYSRH